jgi:hypothetical protein
MVLAFRYKKKILPESFQSLNLTELVTKITELSINILNVVGTRDKMN